VELYNQHLLNGMNPEIFAADFLKRLMRWPLLCALLGLVLTRAATAADSLYENDTPQIFSITPQNTPPQIHATNFVNNSLFEVNFTATTINPSCLRRGTRSITPTTA